MKSISILSALFFLCVSVDAQRLGIKSSAAHASSVLDLTQTQVAGSEKGFLMTRMDSTSRVLIGAPIANSLWLYQNKEDSGFYYYNADHWRRAHQTYGTVQMDNNSSLVLNGAHTFTVEHLAPGIDHVTYRDYIIDNGILGDPNVIVTGENTEAPLQLHGNAPNYCVENQNNSTGAHVNSVTISNQTTATSLISNLVTGGSPSTYYAHQLLDNSINDCVGAGEVLSFTVTPGGSFIFGSYLQVWVDWDADGFFETGVVPNEVVYGQDYPNIPAGFPVVPFPHNFTVTVPSPIPAAAQAAFTAVRIMTRTYQTASSAFDGCLTSGAGTTSAEVEDYFIPLCSATGTYPILAPFCSTLITNSSEFRVYCQDLDGEPINVKYHFKVHEK